jgi:D-arabinose 1-dehydrogenase-like Zn-dependent alcohol dehydrogenase
MIDRARAAVLFQFGSPLAIWEFEVPGLVPGAAVVRVPEGMETVRCNGKYLILGHYTDQGMVAINPHVITRKQLRILGSWGLSEAHFAEYVQLLSLLRRRFDLSRLVTWYPLDAVNQALQNVRQGAVMKAALRMGAA